MPGNRKALSGHERNRVFLNYGGKDFYDIFDLTEADRKTDSTVLINGETGTLRGTKNN